MEARKGERAMKNPPTDALTERGREGGLEQHEGVDEGL